MLETFCGTPLDKDRPYIAFCCAAASVIFFLIGSYLVDHGADVPRTYLMLSLFFHEMAPTIRFILFVLTTIGIPASFLLIAGLFTRQKLLLLPWTILSLLSFIVICFDFGLIVVVFGFIGAAIGCSSYVSFCIISLFKKLTIEERDNLKRQQSEMTIVYTECSASENPTISTS